MRNLSKMLFWIPFLISCTKSVTPDFDGYEKEWVVNSLLVPDSAMTVRLNESLRSDMEEVFPVITDAGVEISDGHTTTNLWHSGGGIYICGQKPEPGNSYSLKVINRDGTVLSASTRIPLFPRITFTKNREERRVRVIIQDNPDEKNYYWIGKKSITGGTIYYDTYLASDFLLLDDFNRSINEDASMGFPFTYHFYARLEDKAFNGKSVSCDFYKYWSESGDFNNPYDHAYIYVINADEHLDHYMKTALIQYELRINGDAPVFQTPIDMYSNVNHGKGIFGSYTISHFDITKP